MKKKLLTLLTLISLNSFVSFSQNYTFTQFDSPYVTLSSPTVISTQFWDFTSVITTTLPFSFNYYGTNFNTIYTRGGFNAFEWDGSGVFGDYELMTFDNEMNDGTGNATISYQVTGIAPNRIFKLQVLNANCANDGNQTDYVNEQTWLYEGSNVIEMHYGISSVLNPDSWDLGFAGYNGPSVGLIKNTTTYLLLTGDSSNPTATSSVPSYCVNGAPPVNKVYRFTPAVGKIDEIKDKLSFNIYPNPSKGDFKILTDFYSNTSTKITIKNNLGQIVYTENSMFLNGVEGITCNFKTGVYFVELDNNKTNSIRKIIIQ